MGSLYNRHIRLLTAIAAAFLIYLAICLVWHPEAITTRWARSGLDSANELQWSWRTASGADGSLKHSDLGRVSNKTLGFEKVIAIGLPERSDKRDAVTLMAAMSGFEVDWVDGVKPESIPNKAVPYGVDQSKASDNFLGCWRSHMDAVRQ